MLVLHAEVILLTGMHFSMTNLASQPLYFHGSQIYGLLRSFRTEHGMVVIESSVVSIRLNLLCGRQYRRLIAKDLYADSVRSQLEKMLLLFVDSGLLYCVLWVCKQNFLRYIF